MTSEARIIGGSAWCFREIFRTFLWTDDTGVEELTVEAYVRKYCFRVRRLIRRERAAEALNRIKLEGVGVCLYSLYNLRFLRLARAHSWFHQGVVDFRVPDERGICCLLYTSDAADERSSVDLG